MKTTEPQGKRRTVWLSNQLDAKAEEIRKTLGLSRSGFYRFTIVEVVKQFAQSKTPLKKEEP